MSELKRCPFCGSLPQTEVKVTQMGEGTDHIDFAVVCPKCGINKALRLKIIKTASFFDIDKIIEQVEKEWNQRV